MGADIVEAVGDALMIIGVDRWKVVSRSTMLDLNGSGIVIGAVEKGSSDELEKDISGTGTVMLGFESRNVVTEIAEDVTSVGVGQTALVTNPED